MAQISFSIVVVCLNPGEKLLKTVQSVLNQKYGNYEIVVKDGGSTDGSLEQLPADSRIRVYTRPDSGIYDAMNQAMSYVTGQFVQFLNCGDLLHDDMVLERLAAVIERKRSRGADGEGLGLLAGILGVAVWYVLDDSVLLSSDVEKRCAIPVLGYRTAKPDEQFGALLDAQLRAKASQSAFQEISLDTVLSGTMGLGEEEKIPLILLVRWNTPCIKKLGLALDLLAQREIAVVGVILTDADARFLHAYYRV